MLWIDTLKAIEEQLSGEEVNRSKYIKLNIERNPFEDTEGQWAA